MSKFKKLTSSEAIRLMLVCLAVTSLTLTYAFTDTFDSVESFLNQIVGTDPTIIESFDDPNDDPRIQFIELRTRLQKEIDCTMTMSNYYKSHFAKGLLAPAIFAIKEQKDNSRFIMQIDPKETDAFKDSGPIGSSNWWARARPYGTGFITEIRKKRYSDKEARIFPLLLKDRWHYANICLH